MLALYKVRIDLVNGIHSKRNRLTSISNQMLNFKKHLVTKLEEFQEPGLKEPQIIKAQPSVAEITTPSSIEAPPHFEFPPASTLNAIVATNEVKDSESLQSVKCAPITIKVTKPEKEAAKTAEATKTVEATNYATQIMDKFIVHFEFLYLLWLCFLVCYIPIIAGFENYTSLEIASNFSIIITLITILYLITYLHSIDKKSKKQKLYNTRSRIILDLIGVIPYTAFASIPQQWSGLRILIYIQLINIHRIPEISTFNKTFNTIFYKTTSTLKIDPMKLKRSMILVYIILFLHFHSSFIYGFALIIDDSHEIKYLQKNIFKNHKHDI